MKILYGIPYMGSKARIAPDILRQLPSGERFVDLFGGGFAMSHAAYLSRKYNAVLYNEYELMLVDLIRQALNGDYNYSRFKPEFVTRDIFAQLKDKNGYVKYIWSFGNSGKGYLFGKDKEPLKEASHNFVVFGQRSKLLDEIYPKIQAAVTSTDIHTRREQFCGFARKNAKRSDLERLERLQQLERLERLERLELRCGSYLDYEYQNGDIVYCDPPYEGTAEYTDSFDSKEFYEWAATRPYKVWFSSYKISDKRFKLVWARQLRATNGGTAAAKLSFECLYTNEVE